MNQQIVHRGPDDEGFFASGAVGLAMRRLSIIDLATGHQPLTNQGCPKASSQPPVAASQRPSGASIQSKADYGRLATENWIVFNGEIYNYKALREDLLQRGHRLQTHSDTETIIHLYEEFGRGCVHHLRGMFAFAIWDAGRQRLFLARDRLGIKPLYYRLSSSFLIFASEIKGLLEYPGVDAELNSAILPEYLAFGYLAGEETFYAGINALPPGHWMEVDETGAAALGEYWDLEALPAGPAAGERATQGGNPLAGGLHKDWIGGYRELLEECVASHLMSDVPVGVFLSGGLDSSAVAAIATAKRADPMDTFAVGYKEAAFSELPFARAVAQRVGSRHHEVELGREEFFGALPQLIWHEDKPITWPSSVSLYFVARLAREHVKVVLTGEGSDESLAGYTRYAVTLWNQRLHSIYGRALPPAFRRRLREWLSAGGAGSRLRRKFAHTLLGRDGDCWESIYYDNFLCAFSARELAELLQEEPSSSAVYGSQARAAARSKMENGELPGGALRRLLYGDIKTYLVELLMKQDRMSMAASIESRVPFLDHQLVEFAMQIPASENIRGLSGKWVLKAAIADLLPASIIHRRKMGFPTPVKTWLRGPQFHWAERLLTEPRSAQRGWFKPAALQRLLKEHEAGARDHTDRLWRLVNLELWCRVFLDREGGRKEEFLHSVSASR